MKISTSFKLTDLRDSYAAWTCSRTCWAGATRPSEAAHRVEAAHAQYHRTLRLSTRIEDLRATVVEIPGDIPLRPLEFNSKSIRIHWIHVNFHWTFIEFSLNFKMFLKTHSNGALVSGGGGGGAAQAARSPMSTWTESAAMQSSGRKALHLRSYINSFMKRIIFNINNI